MNAQRENTEFRQRDNRILYQILPSVKDKNSHLGLGVISALFAMLLTVFILWAGITGHLGLWTIIILCFPVLLFAAVSWFVLRFGKDYVAGLRVYQEGISTFYPMKKDVAQQEKMLEFGEINMLEFEENLEVHRVGRQVKRINVYRIRVRKENKEELELFADMIDLLPREILKFRQLPHFLVTHELLATEKIDCTKMVGKV